MQQGSQSMMSEERRNWLLTHSLIAKNEKDIALAWRNLPETARSDEFIVLIFIIAFARIGNFEQAKKIGKSHLFGSKHPSSTWWHLLASSVLLFFNRLGLNRLANISARIYLFLSGNLNMSAFTCFARMYIDMWTDHERALSSTTVLLAKHLIKKESGDMRYLYFHGFILSLNGRIDEGLRLCERAVADLMATVVEEPFYLYWLHEGQSLLATVAFYAGDIQRALSLHNGIQHIFPGPDYFPFNEVYNSSMALRVALAARDYNSFCHHSQVLKSIMGEKYDLRFALRTYSFHAVFDLLRQDQKSAYMAISRADSFAEKSPSRIEIFYHYTQKSRLFLVDGMLNEAMNLIRLSTDGITSTSGAGFHVADALFQHLRCMLVGHTTLALTKEKARILVREEARVLKRLRRITQNSAFLRSKLELYLRLLTLARAGTEAEVLAMIVDSNRDGYDLDEVALAIANQKMTSQKIRERNESMQAATRELERLSSLNDFLKKITADQVDTPAQTMSFSEEYLTNCIGLRISPVLINETHKTLIFRQNISTSGLETFIRPFEYGDGRILKVFGAGKDFTFRQDVIEMINVWWQIANSRLAEYHRQSERLEQSRYKAIAQTTQMLAHDVRKPFSILKGILSAVQSGVTNSETLLKTWLPAVDGAMASVNGMVEDIMEIGNENCPVTAEVALGQLIDETLRDQFRFRDASLCRLSYDFRHTHLLQINQRKMSRVFSNVVANAAEATGCHGHIWFRSTERTGSVEIVIGNEGREIPLDQQSKIFETFYTAEKAGGTGLGLAIARKIVEAHGGRIWCSSEAGSGTVQFHFLLPVGKGVEKSFASLPDSAALYQDLSGNRDQEFPMSIKNDSQYIVVDDDAFIRYAWTDLASLKNVVAFASPDHFWLAVEKDPLLLKEARGIATDYHFAAGYALNGFDFATDLRNNGFGGKIILCSESDIRKSIAAEHLERLAVIVAPKDPVAAAAYFH